MKRRSSQLNTQVLPAVSAWLFSHALECAIVHSVYGGGGKRRRRRRVSCELTVKLFAFSLAMKVSIRFRWARRSTMANRWMV